MIPVWLPVAVPWAGAALLAALLPLDRLFGADAEDGSLDQLLLSGLSPAAVATAKAAAHWLTTGLPLLAATPVAAAMLNLSPDHLDRHGDMAGYAAAKREIFARQTGDDLAVLGADDPASRAMADALRAAAGGPRVLTVSGESKIEEKRDENGYAVRERRFGKFSRSIPLPQGIKVSRHASHYVY